MKTFIAILVVTAVAVTGGTIVYLNHQKASPPPAAPVVESSPAPAEALPSSPPPTVMAATNEPAPAPTPVKTEVVSESKPQKTTTAHSRAVDTLVSTQTSFNDRQALFKKLKGLGELDAAVAELKQRVAEDPSDVMAQIALGEAIMNKFPIQDYSEQAMLGLQIDQSFNAALKADPSNWEAQFSKATALAYWPKEMNTGPEVIQRLSSLIDQQDTMTPQPQFAQTYVLLGEQYQKAGQTDYATTTWKLGLQKFPNDPALQAKNANP